jgi:recombination protein U
MKRGGNLEKRISMANIRYKNEEHSLILKVPVPIEITATGFIAKPSTVDFCGIIPQGRFIAFDAKETKIKTRFDLANIHAHQLQYLEQVCKLGGIGFFLIHFTSLSKTTAYLATPAFIKQYWGTKKSIPYADIQQNCEAVDIDTYLKLFEPDLNGDSLSTRSPG